MIEEEKTIRDYTDDELRRIRNNARAKVTRRERTISILQNELRTWRITYQLAAQELDRRKHALKVSST